LRENTDTEVDLEKYLHKFYVSVKEGNETMVQTLLELGLDVDSVD